MVGRAGLSLSGRFAHQDQSAERLEAALQNLSDGFQKKGTTKHYEKGSIIITSNLPFG